MTYRLIQPSSQQNALIAQFEDAQVAERFYQACNGVVFDQATQDRCIALYCSAVHFVSPSQLPPQDRAPPASHYVLPTCPRCLERLDSSVCGVITPQLSTWPSIRCDVCVTMRRRADGMPVGCHVCSSPGTPSNALWLCLICDYVGCGRYLESHGVAHYESTQHRFTVDVDTQVVWDYDGDGFVHRLLRGSGYDAYLEADGSTARHGSSASGAAHEGCITVGTTETIDEELLQQEEELLNSKLQSIASHYTELLNGQLREQYEYFETKIANVDKELSERLEDLKADGTAIDLETAKLQGRLVSAEKQLRALEKKKHVLRLKVHKKREEELLLKDLNENLKQDSEEAASQQVVDDLHQRHRTRLAEMERNRQVTKDKLNEELSEMYMRLAAQSDTTPGNPRQ